MLVLDDRLTKMILRNRHYSIPLSFSSLVVHTPGSDTDGVVVPVKGDIDPPCGIMITVTRLHPVEKRKTKVVFSSANMSTGLFGGIVGLVRAQLARRWIQSVPRGVPAICKRSTKQQYYYTLNVEPHIHLRSTLHDLNQPTVMISLINPTRISFIVVIDRLTGPHWRRVSLESGSVDPVGEPFHSLIVLNVAPKGLQLVHVKSQTNTNTRITLSFQTWCLLATTKVSSTLCMRVSFPVWMRVTVGSSTELCTPGTDLWGWSCRRNSMTKLTCIP